MHTRKWKLFPEMEKIIPQKKIWFPKIKNVFEADHFKWLMIYIVILY